MHRGAFATISATTTRTLRATVVQAQVVRHASTAAASTTKSTTRTARPTTTTKPSKKKSSARGSSPPPGPRKSQKPLHHSQIVRPVVRMLDHMVKGEEQPGGPWKHMPSRRGEEMRLKQRVVKGKPKAVKFVFDKPQEGHNVDTLTAVVASTMNTKAASAPKSSNSSQTFDSPIATEQVEQEEDFGYIPETPLGSFVELRRNDIAEIGIVVGSGFTDRQWKLSVLTREGESWIPIKADVFFSIPSICPADLATRCGIQPIPESAAQLNARVEVFKRLRLLQREIENTMIAISRQLGSVYEAVRSKNPNEWAEVTAAEVAKIVNKTPTAIEIYATHKLLIEDSARFLASQSYQTDQMFRVRPLRDVENLLQIHEWVRKRDPCVATFLQKAKKVMEVQKELTAKTQLEKPGLERAKHQWNDSDKEIIRFMISGLRHGRAVQKDPYNFGTGHILKGVNNSTTMNHLDEDVHRFLVAIGVFTPWQDLILIDPINKLDLETRPAVLEERERSILRALENSKSAVPTHPDDFYLSDPMASIRRDWGDMPVYVVDDHFAEELDDGISFERIPSEPDNLWIHIHVADPASVIPPTNFLARKAAEQSESWYMIPKSFPLFPKCITHHPTQGLSLGMRSKNNLPDLVMTFSAKLDSEGNVLDQAVQAGIVRNVKTMDYESVDAALGEEEVTPRVDYPFGGRPDPPALTSLSPEAVKDFKVFKKVADIQRRRRLAKNWFMFESRRATIEENRTSLPAEMGGRIDTPHLHRGFPDLVYSVQSMSRTCEYGSRAIVAEVMKLAARAASRFCLERDIPVLRRTSNPMVPSSEEVIQAILASRNEIGYVKEEDILRHIIYTPGAQYTTYPGMHYGVGVSEGEGYVRVTSPLRRYGDLVSHWQIQHALLGKGPRFGREWLEDFAVTLAMKDQYIKGTLRRHGRFWTTLFIKQWQEKFADGKNEHLWPRDENGQRIDDPFENLEGYMLTKPLMNKLTADWQIAIQIPKLGLKEVVVGVPPELVGQAYLGMRLPVVVNKVHLGVKPLIVLGYDKSRKTF